EAAGPGRVADDRVTDDQDAPLRPVKRDLARRLAGDAEDDERTDALARREIAVDRCALGPSVRGVGAVDDDAGARPGADGGGGAPRIAAKRGSEAVRGHSSNGLFAERNLDKHAPDQ